MTATNEFLKEYFHENFYKLELSDERQIEMFISNVVNYAKEIHIHTENEEELSNLPLLAILSEVERKFPDVISNFSTNEPIVNTAMQLLSSYSNEKRDLLRNYFL